MDTNENESFMRQWELGSPMRTFIYYVQRATCGALVYLVVHQFTLGLRMVGMQGKFAGVIEYALYIFSTPGRVLLDLTFDAIRPLHLPPPLAEFFLNILFYFFATWLTCFLYNLVSRRTFLGKRQDPFQLQPKK